ncbi:DUF2933 domain-containing protein [Cryobacterium glaciale]|uniref:DUF2933 domain-containing protein n=1 Tax=Cryobacterium glaciale TaxID=1259145 RepID=A0A4R8UVD5_9MICO|nr:DUF2933 domain-containing protein [Cryobacterium glaciale]TFB71572.1 DUF2933 domain-containing protein [Cryobacterium glaciale]
MTQHDHGNAGMAGSRSGRNGFPLYGWVIIVLAVLGLVLYAITEHWAHLPTALPYIGIVLVAGMHLFGHRGHQHGSAPSAQHTEDQHGSAPSAQQTEEEKP